ncbi:MAG: hypothetical protein ACKKMR_00995 [Candidatus Nealsonbacteria bacterium]
MIEKIINWFFRPRIKVNFEYKLDPVSENDFCHLRRDRITGRLCWFFRMGIENKGSTVVKDCDIRIEKIERIIEEKCKEMKNFSPIVLHWANIESDESRDLHKDTPEFIDVVYTMEGENNFYIFAKRKHIGVGSNIIWPSGQYRLYLKVLGDNIKPHRITVFINFNGHWDQLEMKLER